MFTRCDDTRGVGLVRIFGRHPVRSFLTILLLFAGFTLLLLGAIFVISGLLPSESPRDKNSPWLVVAIGLACGSMGWLIRRTALGRRQSAGAASERSLKP